MSHDLQKSCVPTPSTTRDTETARLCAEMDLVHSQLRALGEHISSQDDSAASQGAEKALDEAVDDLWDKHLSRVWKLVEARALTISDIHSKAEALVRNMEEDATDPSYMLIKSILIDLEVLLATDHSRN